MGARRVFCNISQEGRDDIDDLREGGMIYSLKLMSRQHRAMTAYQVWPELCVLCYTIFEKSAKVSPEGMSLLSRRLTPEIKGKVDRFIEGPNGSLWEVQWNGETFELCCGTTRRTSGVTDCEVRSQNLTTRACVRFLR